jgi:hypothetical protein
LQNVNTDTLVGGIPLEQTKIRRPRRVAIHGLPYFCGKLSAILKDPAWDIRHHFYQPSGLVRFVGDLSRCDLAFTWGGRITLGKFLRAARYFRKKNVVILWCGSDVLYAREELAAGKMDSWVAERIHWAASPALADEVRSLGLSCESVQVSFVQPVPNPPALPEKFSVLVYVPTLERASLYGLDRILEVADAFRCANFTLVGLRQGETLTGPPNLKVYSQASTLAPFISEATVIWRPVRHDAGTSFMVLEALAQGRHVLYSYSFSNCIQATTAAGARVELERLLNLHDSKALGLNHAGIRMIANEFTPERVSASLFRRWAEIIDSSPSATPTNSSSKQFEASTSCVDGSQEDARFQRPLHQRS